MKYMCLTARHHDGFALFDSQFTNAFTSVQTLHRDLFAEYVRACRAAGLRVGMYYSPINWRYPGYFDVTGTNCAKNKWGYTNAAWHKDNATMMKNEVYEQVRTLSKNYGPFDYVFWDGGWLAQQGSDRDAAFFWEPGKYRDPANAWPVAAENSDTDETGRPLGLMGIVRKYSPAAICQQPRRLARRFAAGGRRRDHQRPGAHELLGKMPEPQPNHLGLQHAATLDVRGKTDALSSWTRSCATATSCSTSGRTGTEKFPKHTRRCCGISARGWRSWATASTARAAARGTRWTANTVSRPSPESISSTFCPATPALEFTTPPIHAKGHRLLRPVHPQTVRVDAKCRRHRAYHRLGPGKPPGRHGRFGGHRWFQPGTAAALKFLKRQGEPGARRRNSGTEVEALRLNLWRRFAYASTLGALIIHRFNKDYAIA